MILPSRIFHVDLIWKQFASCQSVGDVTPLTYRQKFPHKYFLCSNYFSNSTNIRNKNCICAYRLYTLILGSGLQRIKKCFHLRGKKLEITFLLMPEEPRFHTTNWKPLSDRNSISAFRYMLVIITSLEVAISLA